MAADPDDPDLLAVATAYRKARIAGETDHAAVQAAASAYRERHPDMPSDELTARVSKLIRVARDAFGQWIHAPMIGEADIWRSAAQIIKRYGEDAPLEAAMRADAMLEARAKALRDAAELLLQHDAMEG